jgi:hypothetical protein
VAARVTQAQLERAVGGADRLLQLVDKTRTGSLSSSACQDFIDDVLDEGNGEVNGYIGLAVDLSDSTLDTAPMLIRYELAIDAYLVWVKSAGGMAVPEHINAEYERVIVELQKIARREKGVGLATRPTTSQQVQQVTKTDEETYFSEFGPRRRFDGWS